MAFNADFASSRFNIVPIDGGRCEQCRWLCRRLCFLRIPLSFQFLPLYHSGMSERDTPQSRSEAHRHPHGCHSHGLTTWLRPIGLVLAVFISNVVTQAADPVNRPNVIIIFTDDQGYGD